MIGFLENEEILSIFEFRYKSNNIQYVRGKQGHTIHFSEGKSFSVDELYDRFYNELVLWADTILNDMEEAEDLVQDFFVRLWEKKLNENLEGERAEYGCPEGKRSEPDSADSGYIGRGKCMGE